MVATNDTLQPDDLKLHLETVAEADDELAKPPDGVEETEEERELRESVKLSAPLRQRLDKVLVDLGSQVPGLTAAETAKLMATKEGKEALADGADALARVDSHLNSVMSERNPLIGKQYGVYGANPRTFAGILRALELSVNENATVAALPENHADRVRVFTPVVKRKVETARDGLVRLVTARIGTRAELSQKVEVKNDIRSEAESVLSDVREHLYANLPDGKKDVRLRSYGFRPIKSGRPKAKPATPPDAPAAPDVE